MPSLPNVPDKLTDPIWQQQPNEAKSHFHWFQVYLSLKPFDRNYQNAWNKINEGGSKENTHYTQYFGLVGRHWRWLERAVAFDLYNSQNEMAMWNERNKERREAAYDLGEKLIKQANRALKKIDETPEDQLKVSLSEAKDVALAGTQLQEAAIPSMQLAADQIQWLLSALPPEKRIAVISKLKESKNPQGIRALQDGNTIDAEYQDVTDYADEETSEE